MCVCACIYVCVCVYMCVCVYTFSTTVTGRSAARSAAAAASAAVVGDTRSSAAPAPLMEYVTGASMPASWSRARTGAGRVSSGMP